MQNIITKFNLRVQALTKQILIQLIENRQGRLHRWIMIEFLKIIILFSIQIQIDFRVKRPHSNQHRSKYFKKMNKLNSISLDIRSLNLIIMTKKTLMFWIGKPH
jgi:NADH:ubiquinone oxidoreductase subunit 4 (subunit M)